MNKLLILLIVCLGACSSIGEQSNEETQQISANRALDDGKPLDQHLSFYVRGLMQELVENMKYVNQNTPVAVASFVLLDSNYQTTTLLGQQLAESFMHEIHKFGIPVVDYKMTGKIKVTDQGDFVFSRDSTELESEIPAHYVFTGTLVATKRGYLVNARVLGMKSRAVIASAQALVPDIVVSQSSRQTRNTPTRQTDSQVVKIIQN